MNFLFSNGLFLAEEDEICFSKSSEHPGQCYISRQWGSPQGQAPAPPGVTLWTTGGDNQQQNLCSATPSGFTIL